MKTNMPIGECVRTDDIWYDQRTPLTQEETKKLLEEAISKVNGQPTNMLMERGTAKFRSRSLPKRLIRSAAIWLGLREERWFDRVEPDPVRSISGRHLMDALNHRRA